MYSNLFKLLKLALTIPKAGLRGGLAGAEAPGPSKVPK